MKIRSFILLLSCITFTTILIFLLGDSQPTINRFVSQTQGKINSWKNSKVIERVKSELNPAEKYLQKLGFYKVTGLYPEQNVQNVPLPIFVTSVSSSDIELIAHFVTSFQFHFPDHVLIVYSLDLSPLEVSKVFSVCNSSSCSVRPFHFDSYPSHVQDLKLCAFRPIIIQEVLTQSGAVMWLDVQFVFTSSDLKGVLSKAKKEGLVSWSINHPTSALTHPRMFDYFHTNQENYFFHRMVQPSQIVLYNIPSIHRQLMLPWVTCALVLDCIAPIGSQSSGCRFDKKPLFRYSGCHRYDMSALNVVLGIMFDFSASRYVAKEEDKFFHHIEFEVKQTTLSKDYVKNSTTIFSDAPNASN